MKKWLLLCGTLLLLSACGQK
ncbi:lipoprotein, partial [Lysinibacillus fusiformis]